MPLVLLNKTIRFDAFFVASKVGKAGITVTVDVYDEAGTKVVNNVAATEIAGGWFTYLLASAENDTAGNYRATFKTADATVDQQHLPGLQVSGILDDLATAINALVATALPPLVDAAVSASVPGLTEALVAASLPPLIAANLTSLDVTARSPVESSGKISIRVNDDYTVAFGRQFTWTFTSRPELVAGVADLGIAGIHIATGVVTDGGLVDGNTTQLVTIEVLDTESALLVNSVSLNQLFSMRITQGGEFLTEVTGVCDVFAAHPPVPAP